MESPRYRYYNDPEFHAAVDMMYASIERCQFTPTELREAVILASIMYAERHPSPPMPINLEKSLFDWVKGINK